ncbi:unnamed protein product, partial [Discosporangium mesarthrocarpum]
LKEYNLGVFGGALSSVRVEWNKRLLSTAGITRSSRRRKGQGQGGGEGSCFQPRDDHEYVSRVELSEKVVDTEEKLRQV